MTKTIFVRSGRSSPMRRFQGAAEVLGLLGRLRRGRPSVPCRDPSGPLRGAPGLVLPPAARSCHFLPVSCEYTIS